jgi:5'-nucleotidase
VTFGEVFTMQPFGNSVVVMSLSGAELKALLESQHKSTRDTPHFLSPAASLRYRWLASAPAGDHVRDLQVAGAPVDPKRDYRVAVNSFLAEGGDGFVLLKAGRDRLGGGQDVEALAEWLKTNPTPISTPRIEWAD